MQGNFFVPPPVQDPLNTAYPQYPDTRHFAIGFLRMTDQYFRKVFVDGYDKGYSTGLNQGYGDGYSESSRASYAEGFFKGYHTGRQSANDQWRTIENLQKELEREKNKVNALNEENALLKKEIKILEEREKKCDEIRESVLGGTQSTDPALKIEKPSEQNHSDSLPESNPPIDIGEYPPFENDPLQEDYPKDLPFKERLEWMCGMFEKSSDFDPPRDFFEDLCVSIRSFCENLEEGYPSVENILKIFYRLPEEILIKKIFNMQALAKPTEVLVLEGMRSVLSRRSGYQSFRGLLEGFAEEISHNKKIKRFINQKLQACYPSVSDCLANKKFDFAINKTRDQLRAFQQREQKELNQISKNLQALAKEERTVLRARDLLIEFLKVHPDFQDADVVIRACLGNRKCRSVDFWKKLLDEAVYQEAYASLFGRYLAKACGSKPLDEDYLTPELLKFWINAHDEQKDPRHYLQAFWNCVSVCSWKEDAILKTCVQGALELWGRKGQKADPNLYEMQGTAAALLHLCKGWSSQALRLKLSPIGVPLIFWWYKVRETANADERKAFLSALETIVPNYFQFSEQYLCYQILRHTEFSDSTLPLTLNPALLLKTLREIEHFKSKTLVLEIKSRLEDISVKYWELCDFNTNEFKEYLIKDNNATNLWKSFVSVIGNKNSANQKDNRYYKCLYKLGHSFLRFDFEGIVNNAKDCIKDRSLKGRLPKGFWDNIFNEMVKELDARLTVESCNEFELHKARIILKSRCEMAKQLSLYDSNRQLDRALDCFRCELNESQRLDLEVQGYLKDYFFQTVQPEDHFNHIKLKVKIAGGSLVDEIDWEAIKEESMKNLKGRSFQLDEGADLKYFLLNAKDLVEHQLKEKLGSDQNERIQEIVDKFGEFIGNIFN